MVIVNIIFNQKYHNQRYCKVLFLQFLLHLIILLLVDLNFKVKMEILFLNLDDTRLMCV